jgi:transcriptional regulator of acetoin/glycerol metabolism
MVVTHAREALLRHEWPGNVRQLRNVLERAAIVCEGSLIQTQDLALHNRPTPSGQSAPAPSSNLRLVERETIARVLDETRWNKSTPATRLGLSRSQLYGRIRNYGLEQAPIVTS